MLELFALSGARQHLICFHSMERSSVNILLNISIFCSTKERKLYRFGMMWRYAKTCDEMTTFTWLRETSQPKQGCQVCVTKPAQSHRISSYWGKWLRRDEKITLVTNAPPPHPHNMYTCDRKREQRTCDCGLPGKISLLGCQNCILWGGVKLKKKKKLRQQCKSSPIPQENRRLANIYPYFRTLLEPWPSGLHMYSKRCWAEFNPIPILTNYFQLHSLK